MIEHIRKYANAFKTGDAQQQYLGYQAVVGALSDLYSKMGRLPLALVDGVGSQTPGPIPPPAQFAVQGIDGKFLVAIVNPQNVLALTPAIARARALAGVNSGFTPILHNLQSALDVNFDNNSSLVDYGISPQLAYEVQDPLVTRFFRLRSSFDGKNWNPWQIYSSPITCGPVGVASGQLRSVAAVPGLQLNSTNFATVDSVDSGTSATIRVYGNGGVGTAWSRIFGTTTEGPFPSGNVLGLFYDTKYFVMFDGTQLFAFTTMPPAMPDNYRYVGTVTTVPNSATTNPATADAVMAGIAPNQTVSSVNVTSGGTGYTFQPAVSFTGGGGTGAAAYATINGAGHVTAVIVTNGGSGYSTPPLVSFVGGQTGVVGGGLTVGAAGGRFSLMQ
jgi:hypothetical protein